MKLRFDVDQAAMLRKGLDCPNSIVTIEINPAKLPQNERDLIADRLEGIDVCALRCLGSLGEVRKTMSNEGQPYRIKANSPDYAGLMEVILKNQADVEATLKRNRDPLGMHSKV